MELKEVEILLQKFFDGQTTVEEENILADFFRNQDVPAELEIYREFFDAAGKLSEIQFEGFEDDVMNHILENENRGKKDTAGYGKRLLRLLLYCCSLCYW